MRESPLFPRLVWMYQLTHPGEPLRTCKARVRKYLEDALRDRAYQRRIAYSLIYYRAEKNLT